MESARRVGTMASAENFSTAVQFVPRARTRSPGTAAESCALTLPCNRITTATRREVFKRLLLESFQPERENRSHDHQQTVVDAEGPGAGGLQLRLRVSVQLQREAVARQV